jgi:hypothetical protein
MREENGQRYVVTIFAHASGATIECAVPLIVQKNDMQGLGSAITYARRYGLMGMAGIAPEDDDGNAAAARPVVDDKPPLKPADPMPRDPGKIAASLVDAITKAATQAAMEAMNEEGTKFAAAWQWLEDNDHKPQAAAVKTAWDARFAALANADLGGDSIQY